MIGERKSNAKDPATFNSGVKTMIQTTETKPNII
jgi:hypothetical protein